MTRDQRSNSRSATTAARSGLGKLSLMLEEVTGGDARQHSAPVTSCPVESQGSDTTMRSTTTGRTDRRWSDRRRKIAGEVLAMCAEQQKALALARGWSEGWVSRLVQGNPAAEGYLRTVERFHRSPKTEAGPLAAAPLAEMARVTAESLTDAQLDDAIDHLMELEQLRESRENAATLRRALGDTEDPGIVAALEDDLIRCHVAEVAASLVLVGVLWERSRRRLLRGERVN